MPNQQKSIVILPSCAVASPKPTRGVSSTSYTGSATGRLQTFRASSEIANIAIDDAMILPYDANLARMEFGKGTLHFTTQNDQLMSERHVLGYKPALRLTNRSLI